MSKKTKISKTKIYKLVENYIIDFLNSKIYVNKDYNIYIKEYKLLNLLTYR